MKIERDSTKHWCKYQFNGHQPNFYSACSSLPEEESEAQFDEHKEELLRHAVAVDVRVEGVRAVQVVMQLVRMLIHLCSWRNEVQKTKAKVVLKLLNGSRM